MTNRDFAHVGAALRDAFAKERASLFMGAGFSSSAKDLEGRTVPLGDELATELFDLCFPGARRDESTLQDLFHHALIHHRPRLEKLLAARLTVDPRGLPAWYRAWFVPPWRRAWTLNVDMIERAVASTFGLPRPVVAVSALTRNDGPEALPPPGAALSVVHLNGMLDDGCDRVTFATTQYGQRLAQRDRWYHELASELVHHCFVFVGTRLDEAPLWQHLEGRDVRGELSNRAAPRSFLVTTKLDRARRSLLEDYCIDWVCASAEEFAEKVLVDCV